MARSTQIRPLETPTNPTTRSRRYPLVHGERPYVPPGGPQRAADVSGWGEVAEGGGSGSGG